MRVGLEQDDALVRLELQALSDESVAALTRAVPGSGDVPSALVSWLVERAQGYPLFVIGLLRALLEGAPISLGRGSSGFRRALPAGLPYEWVRAEAAHALWRCTGDTASTVPVLVRLLGGYAWLPMFAPVHSVVVECLGHIGPPAEPAAPILIGYLQADRRRDRGAQRHDPISWDQHGQHLAAAALSQIRPADPSTRTLTPPQDHAH